MVSKQSPFWSADRASPYPGTRIKRLVKEIKRSLSLHTTEIESTLEICRLRFYDIVTRLHFAEIQ